MGTGVVMALRHEEDELLRELHTSVPLRRLIEVRRLLDLYTSEQPVGAAFDALIAQAAERTSRSEFSRRRDHVEAGAA